MLDADILPRVISGTSAGGIVAALICCYTDAELRELLVPDLATRLTAFEEPCKVWIKRFWRTGARFDSIDWARKVSETDFFKKAIPQRWCYTDQFLHPRIDDFQGGIYEDRTYPEYFCYPCRSSFVSPDHNVWRL